MKCYESHWKLLKYQRGCLEITEVIAVEGDRVVDREAYVTKIEGTWPKEELARHIESRRVELGLERIEYDEGLALVSQNI